MRSATSSRPMDSRMVESVMPAAALASGVPCRCVVEFGCTTSERTSPTLTRLLNNRNASMKAQASSRPPSMSKENTEPAPSSPSLSFTGCHGDPGSPAWFTFTTSGRPARYLAMAAAESLWRATRRSRVSSPCANCQAACADWHPPVSRRTPVRARMANASGPKASVNTRPWYVGSGSDSVGNTGLPSRRTFQSNVPPSVNAPPTYEELPVRNLVVELTTMSAPSSIGRTSAGVANVLSTIRGTPCAWAASATAGMSRMSASGLPMVSPKNATVSGSAAADQLPGSSGSSTNVVRTPNLANVEVSSVTVPPYSRGDATTWDPAAVSVTRAAWMAAMPEENSTVCTPPSREVIRFSTASTVGFVVRL